MNWLRLRAQAICAAEFLVELYLLQQESLNVKLFGLGLMVYAAIGNSVDALAFYLQEIEEKLAKLSVELKRS